MKSHAIRTGIAVVALVAGVGAATAADCRAPIEATSGPLKALTSSYDNVTQAQIKRSQERAMAAGRRQAIAAWQDKVVRDCPRASTYWFRAHAKAVEICDQAMGGRFTVCARAIPARRIGG